VAGFGTLGSSGAGNQHYFPSLCQRMESMATLVNIDSRGGVVGSRFDYHRHVGLLTGDAFEVPRGRGRQSDVSQVNQCLIET